MYNPSYLVQSRHAVYYFRYPLPIKPQRRVSVSLGTRCPREALQLAKALEYHTVTLIARMDIDRMDHNEIIDILKDHYSDALEKARERLHKEGLLTERQIELIDQELQHLNEMIEFNKNDFPDLLDTEYEDPSHSLDHKLTEILAKHGLEWDKDSKELYPVSTSWTDSASLLR